MTDLVYKVEKYSKKVNYMEVSEALELYKLTRDIRIRNRLVERYIDSFKKLVDGLDTSLDKDDLLQDILENFINLIDKYADGKVNNVYQGLMYRYYSYIKSKEGNNVVNVLLSTIDVVSNTTVEDEAIYNYSFECLYDKILDIMMFYKGDNSMKYFLEYHMMSPSVNNISILANKHGISSNSMRNALLSASSKIYAELCEEYKYFPSKKILYLIKYTHLDRRIFINKVREKLLNLNLDDLSYYDYNRDLDSVGNSHNYFLR